MKFKDLPEPVGSIDRITEMQAAVPTVPDDEASCCVQLVRESELTSEDDAAEWLVFLRALGLVSEDDGTYRRLSREIEPTRLREAFLERIYLAEEVLAVLDDADEPLDAEATFRRLTDRLSRWERLRETDPETVWRERVRRILGWAATLGLAERVDGGYVST